MKHFHFVYNVHKQKLNFNIKDNKGNSPLMVMMQNNFNPKLLNFFIFI